MPAMASGVKGKKNISETGKLYIKEMQINWSLLTKVISERLYKWKKEEKNLLLYHPISNINLARLLSGGGRDGGGGVGISRLSHFSCHETIL